MHPPPTRHLYIRLLVVMPMPIITVTMKAGRSLEQKRAFAEAVTAVATDHLNVRDAQVIVTYDEKSEDSFFRAGKQL